MTANPTLDERVVLGACLQDRAALELAARQLTPAHFARDSYGVIFATCCELLRRETPVNLYSVGQALHDRGELRQAGGAVQLAVLVDDLQELTRDDTTPALVGHAVGRVVEAFEKRRMTAFLRAAEARVKSNGVSLNTLRGELRRDLDELLGTVDASADRSIGAEDFHSDPPRLEWDIERVRVRGDHGWTGGAPKAMKGLVSLEEARACSTGTAFLGHFTTHKQRVLYVSEEDRQTRLHRRWNETVTGRPPKEIPGSTDLRFLIKAGVRLDDQEGIDILRRHLERHRPGIVILEHFDRLHCKSENKAEDVRPLLRTLDDLHREFGCVFRVQKHHRKEAQGQSKRKGEMLAGSVAQHGWGESSVYLTLVRRGLSIVEVEAKDGDTAGRFLVEYQQGRLVYAGEATAEAAASRREQRRGRVLEAVEQRPGATVEELATSLVVSVKTVRRYLKELEGCGEVVGQQEGSKHPLRFWPKSTGAQAPEGGQLSFCPRSGTAVHP
jgi:hypothetical protein